MSQTVQTKLVGMETQEAFPKPNKENAVEDFIKGQQDALLYNYLGNLKVKCKSSCCNCHSECFCSRNIEHAILVNKKQRGKQTTQKQRKKKKRSFVSSKLQEEDYKPQKRQVARKQAEQFVPIPIPGKKTVKPAVLPPKKKIQSTQEIDINLERNDDNQCLKALFKKLHKLQDQLQKTYKKMSEVQQRPKSIIKTHKNQNQEQQIHQVVKQIEVEVVKEVPVQNLVQVEVVKYVQGPEQFQERIVEIPKIVQICKPIQIRKKQKKQIVRQVERPVEKVVIKQVPVNKYVEKIVQRQRPYQVRIPKYIEKPIQIPVEVPVQVPIQVPVQVPVKKQVEVLVPIKIEIPVQVPVQIRRTYDVEKPYDKYYQVQKRVGRPRYKRIEIPVPIQVPVEVPYEVPIQKIVQKKIGQQWYQSYRDAMNQNLALKDKTIQLNKYIDIIKNNNRQKAIQIQSIILKEPIKFKSRSNEIDPLLKSTSKFYQPSQSSFRQYKQEKIPQIKKQSEPLKPSAYTQNVQYQQQIQPPQYYCQPYPQYFCQPLPPCNYNYDNYFGGFSRQMVSSQYDKDSFMKSQSKKFDQQTPLQTVNLDPKFTQSGKKKQVTFGQTYVHNFRRTLQNNKNQIIQRNRYPSYEPLQKKEIQKYRQKISSNINFKEGYLGQNDFNSRQFSVYNKDNIISKRKLPVEFGQESANKFDYRKYI